MPLAPAMFEFETMTGLSCKANIRIYIGFDKYATAERPSAQDVTEAKDE